MQTTELNEKLDRMAVRMGKACAKLAASRIARSSPMQVRERSDAEVHMLVGTFRVQQAIAAAKSFYRFDEDRHPLVIHDDGSMNRSDCALIVDHFPGARVITRAESDEAMNREFRVRGLPGCAHFRTKLIFTLKLFDIDFFGADKRVIYFDSDVLFYKRPSELLEAWTADDHVWRSRFNRDIAGYYYWWAPDELRRMTGLTIHPGINAGLLCTRRNPDGWTYYEDCLRHSGPEDLLWYAEQTLQAISFTREGARPLPDHYDVSFRNAGSTGSESEGVIWSALLDRECTSRHFCGREWKRQLFFLHFLLFVAPEL